MFQTLAAQGVDLTFVTQCGYSRVHLFCTLLYEFFLIGYGPAPTRTVQRYQLVDACRWGCMLAYQTRNGPDEYNEAMALFVCLAFILGYATLILGLQYLLVESSPTALGAVRTLGTVLGVWMVRVEAHALPDYTFERGSRLSGRHLVHLSECA